MWLKEAATALKEEDSIEAVFVLKHCPYKMKQFENTLLELSKFGDLIQVTIDVKTAYFDRSFVAILLFLVSPTS